MKTLNIIDGPLIDDLHAVIQFDDRSRYEDFKTEEGWKTIYMQSIEINSGKDSDVRIENSECRIEYNSHTKNGVLTFFSSASNFT